MLLRLPIEGVDPTSDDFWDDLALAAETQLDLWLDRFESAINQFENDLLSSDESGAVEGFTLDTFMTLLAFLPEGGEMAVGVLTIAKGIYDLLPLESPIELAAFTRRARENKGKLSEQVKNHDRRLELFRLLDEAKNRESPTETDMAAREAAKTAITTTLTVLPSFEQFGRALSLDWIRSSQDSWDPGSEAGIIWANVTYPNTSIPWEEGHFRLTEAQIDDASRPEGVITSLKGVYGDDTPLELLPIEMVVHVQYATTDRGLQIVQFVNPQVKPTNPTDPVSLAAKPTDLRDAPSWTFLSGSDAYADLWDERRIIPRSAT